MGERFKPASAERDKKQTMIDLRTVLKTSFVLRLSSLWAQKCLIDMFWTNICVNVKKDMSGNIQQQREKKCFLKGDFLLFHYFSALISR
jgi:hypothetical protein